MDATRALLDELMGEDRNGDRQKVKRKLTDRDVCKMFIVGMCPYEEFERTKHDVGPCPLIHDEELQAEWKALDDKSKDRLGFERELFKYLDRLMIDLRAKKRRNEDRLAADAAIPISAEDQTRLTEMNDELTELLTKSEVLGEQGDVDGAQAAASQAEALRNRKAKFEEDAQARAGNQGMSRYGQQEVCPYSGVIVNKEESRIRDHKGGRNYRAWVKSHEFYEALKATLERREMEARSAGGREREHGRERERERGRSRGEREREREFGVSGNAGRRRSRSRERGRERDADRERDYGRERRGSGYVR